MKSENQKIIFLNSYLPRTGHNFASEVIRIFSDHEVLAHSRSETRLSSILHSYYSIYDRKIFHQSDKDFFDELFIDNLRERILNKSDKQYIMIKDTNLIGVDSLIRVFPNDIHLILVRDPKSVFLSLIKGMRLEKRTKKNNLKRLGIKTGLYPYYYSKKLSKQVLQFLPDTSPLTIIRYENLVKKEEKTISILKEKFGTLKSIEKIKEEIDNIEVINSSFFNEVGAKGIWDMRPRTSNYNPLHRKGHSNLVRMSIALGSKNLRRRLGYI
ncbi:hypothetical protein G3I01_00440 [Gramella sp. MT6]|uniref:sulfotransferase n=1 Tax=Gramella sp. MT6 TaxID=2705471 RepID=UPI001C5F75D9|nr:sulfotransferase [Gramella sp. MT6]QYA24035.1 hypothetical protein G3I01_00440 [Gramella sp. MT6]